MRLNLSNSHDAHIGVLCDPLGVVALLYLFPINIRPILGLLRGLLLHLSPFTPVHLPFPSLSIWTIINLHFSTQMISSKPLIINRLFLR